MIFKSTNFKKVQTSKLRFSLVKKKVFLLFRFNLCKYMLFSSNSWLAQNTEAVFCLFLSKAAAVVGLRENAGEWERYLF